MGKPLGPQAQNQPVSAPANTGQTGNGILDERGRKIIPDIDVKNLRSQRSGDKMLVKAWIFNNSSDQVIRIDTTEVLSQKRTQNQEINPNSSRELTLYDGPVAKNDNERDARIAYRLKANQDVFMESYDIEYHLEPDGKFVVEELHDDGPVRDI